MLAIHEDMNARTELVDVLADMSLFADLARPQLEAAAHTFEEASFQEGQRVLRQGFSGPGFYVIVSGDASVRINGAERSRLAKGDFFGEVAVLLGEAATADVVAINTLRCVTLPGTEVQKFLLTYPPVMYRILQAEARRLQQAIEWRT